MELYAWMCNNIVTWKEEDPGFEINNELMMTKAILATIASIHMNFRDSAIAMFPKSEK